MGEGGVLCLGDGEGLCLGGLLVVVIVVAVVR